MAKPKRVTDEEMLDAIEAYWAEHGYAPTVRSLGRLTGLRSTSTVQFRLIKLADAGRIEWVDGHAGWAIVKEET